MTVKQLKKILDTIPTVGAINRARRREILAKIFALEGAGK